MFSDGNPDSNVMIIGEGPGANEDKEGLPFVGRAGQLLDKMLNAINLNREKVYITNVVNYRPPENRKPTEKEVERYLPYLKRHIEIIKPKIILSDIGMITETDVSLAKASDALLIAFNVKPTKEAKKLAEQEKVQISSYNIIYEALDFIKAKMSGLLAPEVEEKLSVQQKYWKFLKCRKLVKLLVLIL